MKKPLGMLTACILGLFILTALPANADNGPEEIILKSTVDPANKAKPAFFPHAKHQGNFECSKCHHSKDEAGKQVSFSEGMQIEKCEACHNTKTGMPEELDTFKKTAHIKCKGCHTERKKEGLKAGPTKCSGCHKKDLK